MFELVDSRGPLERAFKSLRESCPSFEPAWQSHLADWAGYREAPGFYTHVGVFARHLVALLEVGDVSEFPGVFSTIEALVSSDNPDVHELAKVGLLEDLGNIAANHRDWAFAGQFRTWLGPRSTIAWDELHRFWGTSDSGGPIE